MTFTTVTNAAGSRISIFILSCFALQAQRPTNPALMEPQKAPEMDYAAVADPLPLPAGLTLGAPASAAFDAKGNLFVLYRGMQAFAEFDTNGKFVRSFGDGLFRRSHGLTIDRDGNLWATDVGAHIVMKLNPQGQTLLTIGTKGEAGEWNEATQSHHLNEPNQVAIGRNGDVFVVQGHTPGKGDPRVLKFDKNGNFKKSWGGLGTEPGKFNVAHGVAFDAKGQLWVADRENERIQIFDDEGKFIREIKYAGLPCGFAIGDPYIYMVNGFAGQLLRLDLNGNVLAAVGKSGKGVGEFGEAHYVAVSPKGEVYVTDTVNSAVQKFVPGAKGAVPAARQ
jgi:DNA-binding beta-propeller fold protein YncE